MIEVTFENFTLLQIVRMLFKLFNLKFLIVSNKFKFLAGVTKKQVVKQFSLSLLKFHRF